MFVPGQLERPSGVLTLDEGCLSLVVDGSSVPIIWPPGTSWGETESEVHLADGTNERVGEGLSPDGMYLPAFTVQYVVGDQAQMAIDACEMAVADREAPVLVIKDT